jgi:hypothetical protein
VCSTPPQYRHSIAQLTSQPPLTQVDHGLDGEDVSRLHGALGLVLGIVRHVGRGVEQLPDAVAAVGRDDGALGGLGDHVDGLADIPAVVGQREK